MTHTKRDDSMSIKEAAPGSAGAETIPQVGIFWGLLDHPRGRTILHVGISLQEAEIYGDCLTDPRGHHEVWEHWRQLGTAELRRRGLPSLPRKQEYEVVPRGRIVYDRAAQRFILYADRKLQAPEFVGRVRAVFGLTHLPVLVRSDAHYRTPAGA